MSDLPEPGGGFTPEGCRIIVAVGLAFWIAVLALVRWCFWS
jgi:hypothetical protein